MGNKKREERGRVESASLLHLLKCCPVPTYARIKEMEGSPTPFCRSSYNKVAKYHPCLYIRCLIDCLTFLRYILTVTIVYFVVTIISYFLDLKLKGHTSNFAGWLTWMA